MWISKTVKKNRNSIESAESVETNGRFVCAVRPASKRRCPYALFSGLSSDETSKFATRLPGGGAQLLGFCNAGCCRKTAMGPVTSGRGVWYREFRAGKTNTDDGRTVCRASRDSGRKIGRRQTVPERHLRSAHSVVRDPIAFRETAGAPRTVDRGSGRERVARRKWRRISPGKNPVADDRKYACVPGDTAGDCVKYTTDSPGGVQSKVRARFVREAANVHEDGVTRVF